MYVKKIAINRFFTDLFLSSFIEKNRAMKRMEQISAIAHWSRIENPLPAHYRVGKRVLGNNAYPPMILMNCLLFQQQCKMNSTPELEPQIIPLSPDSGVDYLKRLCVRSIMDSFPKSPAWV